MYNEVGKKYGRLTVTAYYSNRTSEIEWECMCDCGNFAIVRGYSLRSGRTRSCGCYFNEIITQGANLKHGKYYSKIYKAWTAMLQRCDNPDSQSWLLYGGRGITVCEEWFTFENFLKDMGEPSGEKFYLDRINPNGNYELSNCRWVTAKESVRNRRTTIYVEYNAVVKPLGQWVEELNLNYNLVYTRIYQLGWSIEKAFSIG